MALPSSCSPTPTARPASLRGLAGKEAHGEKRMGIVRSTFIVDKQGLIRHALYDVKPKGHAAQVLELVRSHLMEL